jgi:hypothetical protein
MSVLPDSFLLFVFYTLFFSGIALIVASWFITIIPLINKYRWPTQVIGIVVFGAGCYMLGGYGIEMAWRERVKELEAKVAAAEEKSQQTNIVIQERVVTKVKVIRENVYINKELNKEVGKQLDAQCTLPRSAVVLHDSASRNEVASGPASTDGTSSGVKASELLNTVIDNYGTCNEVREKLKAWQVWYREQKEIFESVK